MQKIIWTYWHQGFSSAPDIIQKCINRLHQLQSEADVHLLDQNTVYECAERVPIREGVWQKLSLPHQSDLLRTQLLIKYGGIWLDPTVFCLQPLDSWLPQQMEAGVLLFHRPGRDRIISNWFIAAEKDNYLLARLYETLIDYWSKFSFEKHE